MKRPTIGVGHKPNLWLLFILRLRKCLKLRYLLILFFSLIIFTYLRLINHNSSDQQIEVKFRSHIISSVAEHLEANHLSDKCNFDQTESLLRYKPVKSITKNPDDTRPSPSIQRLHKLFSILISHEEKLRQALDYLGIFRFNNLYNTLRPFANNTQRLNEIYCHFQRYITVSDNGHIDITPQLIDYLKQVSNYLSDGFNSEHSLWNKTSINNLQKPVIILAANSRFYDTLQASMRTVNEYFSNHLVVIYDLGFDQSQLDMVRYSPENIILFILFH
jgi:hypothetical protein